MPVVVVSKASVGVVILVDVPRLTCVESLCS